MQTLYTCMIRAAFCCGFTALLFAGRPLMAESITIVADQDNTVNHGNADGDNADSVMGNEGTDPTMAVRGQNSTTVGTWSSKAWIRFDLSNQRYDADAAATVVVTASSTPGWGVEGGQWARTLRLWALNKGYVAGTGKLGTDWKESEITWNNAPGNINSGQTVDGDLTTQIGALYHDPEPAIGDQFSYTLDPLGDYVQADESVTVMLTISGNSSAYSFATKEHATLQGPKLTFAPGPPPGTVIKVR